MKNRQFATEHQRELVVTHAVINNIKFQATRESLITQSSASGLNYELTVDILDAVAPTLVQDDAALEAVVQCVQLWTRKNADDYDEIKWQADLIEFAAKHEDIVGVYASAKASDNYEFVIIMNDVTDDNVFAYNEFCFEFAERYTNVTDFMVIDVEEASGCHDLLSTYDMIYMRG